MANSAKLSEPSASAASSIRRAPARSTRNPSGACTTADTMLNTPIAIPSSTKLTCIAVGSNGNMAGTAMMCR